MSKKDDEYFVEWNSGHNDIIYIYKKVRPANAYDLFTGQMLNFQFHSWKDIHTDKYTKYWFVVDVLYSYLLVDFQEPIIARIDLEHDRFLDKITYDKAIAMIL